MEKRFTTETVTGDEIDLLVVTPTNVQLLESEKVYKKSFRKALEEGAMLRKKLTMYMIEQGIWNDEQEAKYEEVVKNINLLDYQLNKGKNDEGKTIKLSEGKKMALDLNDKRSQFRQLIAERQELDHLTAEGQADNERFSYLVYLCTLDYNTRKPYFNSYDEYLSQGNEKATIAAASHVGEIVYEIDPDYENSLTENKFLKRFGFANKDNHLVNKDGELVDREGNLIDEEGYILKDGGRVNINDLPILQDEENVEKVDFEDDLGVLTIEKKPPRKRTVKKTE
jgi:hypothetical protein